MCVQWMGQDMTGQGRTGQDGAGQGRAGQDRTGQGRVGQGRAQYNVKAQLCYQLFIKGPSVDGTVKSEFVLYEKGHTDG